MASELKQKTIKGLLWSVVDNFSNLGVSFIIGIILARLLSPDDYGLLAMINVFLAISRSFIDSGFGNALIRKQDMTHHDCSTAFIFNVVVSLFFYLVLFFLAPLIASFYHRPILTSLLRVEAVCMIINAFVIVQITLINKKVDFKKTTKISLISNVISGGFGIFLAYCGYGVWALVGMHILASLISAFLFWLMTDWYPTLVFSYKSFKYLFGFGSKLLATGILDVIFRNLYPILIGKFFSASSLGFYTRAETLAKLPSETLTGVIQRVTFPVLSQIQDDEERLSANYRKLLKMTAFIIFPLMVGLAAVAKPLILVLLTAKWSQSIIYLQIICFGMMWYPIHAINLNLLQVKGRTDIFLKIDIIKRFITVVVLFCAISYGVIGMCFASVISSLISLFINTYYTGKMINVGFVVQLKDLLPILLNSFLMAGIVFYSVRLFDNNFINLLIGILIGVISYAFGALLLAKDEVLEFRNVIYRR
ncbi:lipopolysaccharide biosynthesis protein [Hoylesella timonensis]|uniref:Flippase n=1 Tax=Hoylesella timonensis TaxID=386414 RepID=A0A2N6Q5P2_9BACT|nr:lipopolysaccharide biosynthesis protein [Hoylesella timonensis]PMC10329.1 flippase [Hoylesella timonensis]